MNISIYLKFFGNNLLFSFSIILISFVLGWLLYDKVVTRGISLRDALFEKDNPAAWIEFIGAFIFPALYLGAKAIEGSANEDILLDLGICMAYAVVFVILLSVLRIVSGAVVKSISLEDQDGKINLNNEIFNQRNISASLFSTALSTIFVSMIRFLDILPQYLTVSLLKVSVVLIFSLVAVAVYCMVLRYRTALLKEIFVDNNTATGVSFLGFVFGVETILSGAVTLQAEFSLIDLAASSLVSLAAFGLLSLIFKILFSAIVKVDIWLDVYEHNSIGAAIGQSALYIGIANVIIHFLK